MTARKRALVLSGGGGRGAYHVGVLRFLEEHEWVPDIVVGTSIGAVNGAAIASGHNAHSLWALWKRLDTGDVQRLNLALNPLKIPSLLDTQPLRESLLNDGWIHFDRLNSSDRAAHLRVTAMEVETGRLRVFGNSSDVYPSQMMQRPLTVEHIIASCSIPLIYPATAIDNVQYWDGGTVANTPLSPAIDAGADDIVVVLMTPWDSDGDVHIKGPTNLFEAASAAFEWALLASFQADLKMFRRVNKLVKLQIQNARLRAEKAALLAKLRGEEVQLEDKDQNGIPDLFEEGFRVLPEPIIVAPKEVVPVTQIIRYTLAGHQDMYERGYADAKTAWREAGRIVE